MARSSGESESLFYGPGGELAGRQVGERFTFYVGEYATVTAWGAPGCGASCAPQAWTVEVDNHVVFAGTRITSVKPSRTLYYYRTRLGTVVGTTLGGGVPGAGYRYSPYGEVDLSVNETEATRSELGYTNALRLTGSLLYLKNRVYDAEARVFLQADTVDRLRYAYVHGDPVNLSDPSGLAPPEDGPVYIVDGAVVSEDIFFSFFRFFQDPAQNGQRNDNKNNEKQTEKEREKQKKGVALTNEQEKADREAEIARRKREGLPEELVTSLNENAKDLEGTPYPPRKEGKGEATEKDDDGGVKSCDCGGCTHEVFPRSGMPYEYRNSSGLISQDAKGNWQSQLAEFNAAAAPVPGAIGVIPGKHVFLYLGENAMAGDMSQNTTPPVQADSWSARRPGKPFGRTAWGVAYKADKEKVVWLIYVGRQP